MTGSPPPDTAGRPPRRATTRRLLALARDEWRTLAVASVFLLVGSAMGLIWPQAIRLIIDAAVEGGDPRRLDVAAMAMLGVFAVQGVAIALRYHLFTVAGERVVARLRSQLFAHLVALDVAFFDRRRTGELLNRLASDTAVLQNTVTVNVSMALRSLVSVLGGMALLWWTSPTLTAWMLVVVPPVAIGAVVFGRRIRRLSREVQDALAEASNVAEEALGGLRTVRLFTREAARATAYTGAVERSFRLARRRAFVTAVFTGAASTAGFAAVVLVLWRGGHLVLAEAMSLGQLTSFVLYTLIVAFSLGTLAGLWTDLMRASGAAERVFDLLDERADVERPGGLRPEHAKGRVAFRGVRFAYPTRPDTEVLAGIDLELAPGSRTALVGPSGGGKSTLAGLLCRLHDVTGGSIEVDGHDVRELDARWLRENIGVVAQEPLLFSGSIEENIRFGREGATAAEVRAAAEAANALEFIESFPSGMDTRVGERGVQLSGGQKQRVAIARALLRDPAVLILDEATSALDAGSERLVQEALERLMEGRTTLIIAHRLSTVRGADRIAVVQGGRIAEAGTHDALIRGGGAYAALVSVQLPAAG
ncbi:MAG: ATP-binding cassette domain-containing protein [Deltaproteobacteria bacterium]|nr:MAG: ATP-binding cassette domain-containing protein [Deltaproteobacteria bacterium]